MTEKQEKDHFQNSAEDKDLPDAWRRVQKEKRKITRR